MPQDSTVYIVDDDIHARRLIELTLSKAGLETESFASGEAFIADATNDLRGCIVLDLMMDNFSGMQVHAALLERGINLPVIVLSATDDVMDVAGVMKAGAIEFLRKPFAPAQLVDAVKNGIALDQANHQQLLRSDAVQRRFSLLTTRETEVLRQLVDGLANKQVALALGISARTVEIHRARIMQKLCVDNMASLMTLWMSQGGTSPLTLNPPDAADSSGSNLVSMARAG